MRSFHASRCVLLACVFLCLASLRALALIGATADGTDRFPFVVQINLDGQLICSGTVIFPRLIVTAAHCLQQKVLWRGASFYVDDYFTTPHLSVTAVQEGKTASYAVANAAVSPDWRNLVGESFILSLPYDLALVVTEQPIAIEGPLPSLVSTPEAAPDDAPAEESRKALLVAFGGAHCRAAECVDAGVRRFVSVAIMDRVECSRSPRERDLLASLAVWCLDQSVMPGDSGGPLLREDSDGKLRLIGVISAQQGLPPELARASSRHRTLAADLDAHLPFIAAKAKELGYAP